MWVARFRLHDDEDIYSPICIKDNVECFAIPYTNFEKKGKINLIVGMILIGEERNKRNFIADVKKDKRIVSVEKYHDFILVHAIHPISRESRAEIKRFYNPEYITVRPVHLTVDGWEFWEVACIDRGELNKLIEAAVKHYHGKLISVQEETLHNVASLGFLPELTKKQMESLKLAYKEGYYSYPHSLTIPALAKKAKKSYSTFQEHLSKAENKLVDYFLKYR